MAAAVVAVPVAYVVDPNTTHVPLCPLHAVTGWWCPFCGATRSAHALLHGDLGSALHDNVLFVLALPVLAWWYSRPSGSGRTLPRPILAGLVALLLGFSILRNLGIGSWLAPPGSTAGTLRW